MEGSRFCLRNAHVALRAKEQPALVEEASKTIATFRQALKPTPCDHVERGQVVLCKMRGFCEWPAIVTGFEKNLITVEFFGDHTTQKTAI